MNAPMDKAGRLRGSSQSTRTLHPLSQPAGLVKQKHVFQVLENSAVADAQAPQGLITSSLATAERFDFYSPESDLILSDPELFVSKELSTNAHNLTTKVPCGLFDEIQSSSAQGTKVTLLPTPQRQRGESRVKKVGAVAQFILQKVISRKFVGYRPSPKSAPEKILHYVVEELHCGHKLPVYPVPGERFNARTRSCHECLKELIHAVEGRKPVQKVLQPRRKQTGNSIWPLVFIAVLLAILAATLYARRPKIELYACQWCQPSSVVNVLAQYSDYQFLLQRVVNGTAEDAHVLNICKTQKPWFRVGYTLKKLAFVDRGDCWDTEPISPAYLIVRTADGWPKLPSNCTQDSRDQAPWPVSCNGIPKF